MMDKDERGESTPLPLDGVRVLDFTQVMLGPCCTQVLGDYGADVIKVERVGLGDLSRWSIGSDPDGGNNPVFSSLNRNKREHRPGPQVGCRQEDNKADSLDHGRGGQQFQAGASLERMGLGYEDLRKINSRIIYAVGTGFGLSGPYSDKGGQDVLAQADERCHGIAGPTTVFRFQSIPPHSPITPRECTSFKESCSRYCKGRRREKDNRSRFRSTTPCLPCRCRRRPC